jgi:hypothetical protein
LSLNCSFGTELENIIYTLLRKPVRITGEGRIPAHADRPDLVEIKTICELPSLELGRGMFFANSSIEELAASQNIRALKNASEIATGIADDEDIDAMLDEIYCSRR